MSETSDVRGTLAYLQRTMEERTCRVETPHGPYGTVERVFQRRGRVSGVYGCKVLMEGGTVRYFDIGEVYVY